MDFEAKLDPANCAYTGPFTWEVTKAGTSIRKVTQCAATQATGCAQATIVTDPDKFSHTFTSPGEYEVTVTIQTQECTHPSDTDSVHLPIKDCCPQLIGPLNASQKPGDSCTWLFSAQVSNPNNAAISFEWSFHDGATATTSLPQVEHTYPLGGITAGTTIVVMKSTGCPDQSLFATVTLVGCLPCPPGQHRDAHGNCVEDTCPPGQHRDASGNCVPDSNGFNWCCFLILAWAVVNLIFGLALYYQVWTIPYGWIALIVIGGFATILLGLWIAICCWPCAKTFWRCCVFLQWQFIASFWVGFVLSMLVLLCNLSRMYPLFLFWLSWACGGAGTAQKTSEIIAAAYDVYFVALLLFLSTLANCGKLANPLDPRTWPPCKCEN